ncbi:PIN domain-containing protein [Candidatus Curtissbacteria bacterium]|nr:PIN domain-containing protein [Candidatus Curtissbacteria bacterium]
MVDTDILVDFFHNQDYAKKLIGRLAEEGKIHISILTITELRTGFTPEQAEFLLPKLYKMVTILPITVDQAELAGKFRYQYRIKGKILSTIDTLIAAATLSKNLLLITRNKKDFPMPEIKLYELQN